MITLKREKGMFIVKNSKTFSIRKFHNLVVALSYILNNDFVEDNSKKDCYLKRFNEWSKKPCPKWLFYTMFILTLIILIIINL